MNKNKLPVLRAREKIEEENRVFRCGAQSCPERLATLKQGADWTTLLLCEGYDFHGQGGGFTKSLHKPRRQSQGVAIKRELSEGWLIANAPSTKMRDEMLDALPSRVALGITFDAQEFLPSSVTGQCARCGRRSKIRCEN